MNIKIISISLICLTLLMGCNVSTNDIVEDEITLKETQVAAEKVRVSIKITDSKTGEVTQDLKEVINNTREVAY